MRYHARNRNKGICRWGLCLWLFPILFSFQAGTVMGTSVPQTINTPSIEFTGRRFSPKVITTDKIIFTGRRFSPESISTPTIVFTGRGYGTVIDLSKIKEELKTQQEKTVALLKAGNLKIGGQKAMSGKSQAGPGGGSLKETKIPGMKVATLTPVKPGAKLAFKGHKILETLYKTADKPFDLVFPVINTGDKKSIPVQYSIACRVLSRDAKCPPMKKVGTMPSVEARMTGKIELKGLRFKPGLYEIAVSLKIRGAGVGSVKKVRLKITSATRPGTLRTITPEAGGSQQETGGKGKPQIKQITPIEPAGEKPSQKEGKPPLRYNVR